MNHSSDIRGSKKITVRLTCQLLLVPRPRMEVAGAF